MSGELGKVVVVVGGDTASLQKAIEEIKGALGSAEKKTKDFGDKLKQTGERLQQAARPMMVFGAAITGGLGVAVKAFGDFDAAMNESLAIIGDITDIQKKDMVDAAEEVAKTTTFSAKEAAAAFYYLASAGLDAEQSIAALPAVSQFAQSGMMDLESATEVLMNSQSALGLKVEDATQNMENMVRVSDVLVEAANVSNGSIMQFAGALSNSAPMMRNLNMEVEEGVAVLSVYADQGIKGEEAGTRLSIVLRDLQTRALKSKDAFKKYNVSVFDSNGMMRNMSDIVGDLERALAGKTDEQKKAILAEMEFQDRSVQSLLSLVGMSKEIATYEEKLRKAGGTTKEVADKQLETLNNQLKLAKNNIEIAATTIGVQLAPAVIGIAGKIRDLAQAYSEWSGKHPGLSSALTRLLAVIGTSSLAGGTVLFAFGSMAKSLASLITLMPQLSGPIQKMISGFGKIGGATALLAVNVAGILSAAKAYRAFADAIKTESDILGKKVSGFTKTWESLNAAWLKYSSGLDIGKLAQKAVREELQRLSGEAQAFADTLKYIHPEMETLLQEMKQGTASWEAYKQRIRAADQAMGANEKSVGAWLVKAAETLGLITKIPPVLDDGTDAATSLKDELGLLFKSDLAKRIKQIEKALADYKKELAPESEKALREELDKLKKELGLLKPNIENAEVGWSDLEKTMLEWAEKIPPEYQDVADDVNAALDSIVAKGHEVPPEQEKDADEVSDAWQEVCLQLAKDFSEAFADMTSEAGSFADGMKNIISGLASSIGQAFSDMVTPLLSSLGAMAGPVGSLVGGLVGGILSSFASLIEGSDNTAAAVQERWDAAIKALVADLSYLGAVSESTATLIKNFVNETASLDTGGTAVAELNAQFVYLNELIQDTGVNTYNLASYWDIARHGIFLYQQGIVDAAQASDILDDAFSSLRNAVEEMGQSGSQAMRDFILEARAAGLEIGSVTEYINDQLGLTPKAAMNAADGLAAMASGVAPGLADLVEKQKELKEQLAQTDVGSDEWIKLNDAIAANQAQIDAWAASSGDDLNRIAGLTLTTFNAMIANGASAADAMNSIGPTLDILAEKYADLGIEAPASIAQLLKIRGVQEAHEELFSAIDGNKAVLEALANTGYLTAEALTDVATQAGDYYEQLKAAGMTSGEALATMAPTLQAIHDYAAENGIVLDENTQSLIDQAEAAGLVEDQEMSTADAMLAVGAIIGQAFGIDIPEAMQESLDKMNGVGGSVEDAADAVTDDFGGAVSGVTDGPVADLDESAKTVADDWKDSAERVGYEWLTTFGDISDRADDINDQGTEAGRKWEDAAERAKKAWDGVGRGRGGGDGDGGGGSGGGGGVPEYATGGIAWTPQLASIAERGPEVIMDYGDFLAGDFSDAPAIPGSGGASGGAAPVINLSIYAQTLDQATVRRAGEMIYAEVVNQENRRGRRR